MAVAAGRLSLPHIADRLAGSQGLGRHEDWTKIEDLLASPAPARETRRMRSRRHSVPLAVSTAATSAVFAGLLVVGLVGLPGRCSQPDRCETPAGSTASHADSPAARPETVAAKPAPGTPTNRVADAGRPQQPDAAAAPVVQGRSVGETDAAAPVEAVAAGSAQRRHGRSHRQRRLAQ